INEMTSPGARFALGMAEDADVGSNSLQGYELQDNGYFAVEVKESKDGRKFAELVLCRALDRERDQSLRLMLTAVDGGDPPRSGTAQLCINVTDANDNAPVFAQERYRVSLREGAQPGSTVLNVSASDVDDGSNGRITYGFGKMSAKVLQKFAIDAESGKITLQEALDFEDTRGYTLLVVVDGKMQVYRIEVEIMDINDNTPSFQEEETEIRMGETTALGSRFPLAEAHDPDSGTNSLQRYELSGDEHFSLAVQAGPGGDQRPELVLAKALDREEAAFHELVLRASDGGDPARTGTARIRVAVLDANDNAPVFSQAEYTVRVAEDVPVGSVLITLMAVDADEGLNGHVIYS
ncbi:PCDGH protein, partial [Eolophus roseicapillus]|nr:PCDGH protein [Eolophus roseicapilla]